MDITKMSETELKALKSDIYEMIAQQQQNLQVINQELVKRSQYGCTKGETGGDSEKKPEPTV